MNSIDLYVEYEKPLNFYYNNFFVVSTIIFNIWKEKVNSY